VVSGYDLFMRAENDEDLAELTRLLYVATTRAADYLILSAGLTQLDDARGPWMTLLGRRFDLETGRFLADPAVDQQGATGILPVSSGATGVSPVSSGATGILPVSSGATGISPVPVVGQIANLPETRQVGTLPHDTGKMPVAPAAKPDRDLVTGDAWPLARVTSTEPPLGSKAAGKAARHDLLKLVEDVRHLAAKENGPLPKDLEPVPADPRARRQYSFSRLAGTLHARPAAVAVSEEESIVRPAIDPLGLGTLVHAVLAQLGVSRTVISPDGVAAAVRRHAYRHLPDVTKGLDEPIELIGRLLASPRWAAISAAAERHTELEFLLAWPPGNTDPEAPYLQGFIDCLYRDAAGWHVVDYKTNRTTVAEIPLVAEAYEMQMLVYALAVERILGQPPKELVLHFLRPGAEHFFAWDAAARKRAVAMVDEAISRAGVHD